MRRMVWCLLLAVLGSGASGCGEAAWPEVKPAPRAPEAPSGPKLGGTTIGTAAPAEVAQVEVPAEAIDALRPLLVAYDKAHTALTGDTLSGVAESGSAMAEAARAARAHLVRSQDQTLAALLVDVETKGRKLGEGDIEAVRLTYGELSKSLLGIVSVIAPLREGRFVFECPMAKGYQKWLQREPNLRNPYFGASMLTCGDEGRWAP